MGCVNIKESIMKILSNLFIVIFKIIVYFILSILGGSIVAGAMFIELVAETLDNHKIFLTKKVNHVSKVES